MARSTLRKPTDLETIRALRAVGRALGTDAAYVYEGSYWFPVSETWVLGVSPDDAGRFRVRACYGATEVATLWSSAHDLGRLADLARSFKAEVAAVTREG